MLIPFHLIQVQYGGRVTDDFDKRLLCTFTSVWFSEALLTEGFKFYEGYPLPDYKTIEEYLDHIINMPLQDIPEVFGLHSNADISYQVKMMFVLRQIKFIILKIFAFIQSKTMRY